MKTLKIGLIIGLFFVVQNIFSQVEETEQGDGYRAMIDYNAHVVTVAAYGTPNPLYSGSMAEKLVQAITEARKNAYTRMAIFLDNIRIDGETTIAKERVVSNRFRIGVDELVKNAREIHSKRSLEKDGSVMYQSTIGIVMVGSNSINSYLVPRLKEKAEQNPPRLYENPDGYEPQPKSDFNPATKYTGLIVKAKSMGLQPALAPRIFSEDKREVYGSMKVEDKYFVDQGIVGYSKESAPQNLIEERVGSNPLVIKAVGVSGINKADVIVSNDNAGKILYADQVSDFLRKCRVLFFVD